MKLPHLKGIGIGNGWCSPEEQIFMSQFHYQTGLIGKKRKFDLVLIYFFLLGDVELQQAQKTEEQVSQLLKMHMWSEAASLFDNLTGWG